MVDKSTSKQNNVKTILTVVLLVAFPIAGVPMMWIYMKWHLALKLLITILWLPATIMFYSNLVYQITNAL